MKKRVLLLVLAVLALTFALVSCGGGHEHDYQQKEVTIAATCDTAGKALYACECGESEEREVPATGHTGGEVLTKEPTCRVDGYKYKVCSTCNAEYDVTDKVAAGENYHDYSDFKETTKVDCGKQQNGMKQYVCTACGKVDTNGKTELIKWAHDYEVVTKDATCKEAGSKSSVCKSCGAYGPTEVIAKLPHTENLLESVPAACGVAGYDSFECTVCNETWKVDTAEALEHIWAEELSTEAPTCTLPGFEYQACTREGCNGKNVKPGQAGEALGHEIDYADSEYTEVVAATCITNGSITPICKRCNELLDNEVDMSGKSYVKVIQATEEHFVNGKKVEISSKEATCHEAAYVEYQCTVDSACTEVMKEHSGEKLEHVWTETPTAVIEAKCNADGYDLYVCTLCETDKTENSTCDLGCIVKNNYKDVPHQKTTLKLQVPQTCCDNAYDVWECGDCQEEWNDVYSLEDRPLIPHGTWLKTDTVISPSCTTEGYTIYKCQNDPDCEVTDKQDYTRRTEHPFTEYIDGRLVCNVCNVTYRDVTTYIDEAIQSGELNIDGDTSLNWELKGYETPATAETLEAGVAYEYVVGGDKLDVTKGIIKLSSNAQATYTVVVEFEGGSKTYEVVDASVFFDLYINGEGEQNGIGGNVTKVTITATAAATVVFFAYEG